MFEAYSRRKYRSTGVIQWMLNNAWPSLIWHLWDHSLRTAGGYFGAKKACEPLHIQYDYDENAVSVVSDLPTTTPVLRTRVRLFDLALTERFRHESELSVGSDGVATVCGLPNRSELGRTHFLLLELFERSGAPRSRNFYWLSSKRDVVDYEKANWYTAPLVGFADFQALAELPAATLDLQRQPAHEGDEPGAIRLLLRNTSDRLALFTRLRLLSSEGEEILPAHFSDNYISLLPFEDMQVLVRDARAPASRMLATPAEIEAAAPWVSRATLRL
jgi:exo-1,4-beta-D-glucosaminidase